MFDFSMTTLPDFLPSESIPNITELLVVGLGTNHKRPLLLARTSDQVGNYFFFGQVIGAGIHQVSNFTECAFLILSPPAKAQSCDVIMHAVQFLGQERTSV